MVEEPIKIQSYRLNAENEQFKTFQPENDNQIQATLNQDLTFDDKRDF